MSWLRAANNAVATLAEAIAPEDTDCVVGAGEGALFSLPCRAVIGDEIVTITGAYGDTLEIVRAQEGTAAAYHDEGATISNNITAGYLEELQARADLLEVILAYAWGGGDGVLRGAGGALSVTATDTPDLYVQVATGYAFIGRRAVARSSSGAVGPVVAPVTNPRIDLVQITVDEGVSIKTGEEAGSPTPPTPDAASLAIGYIHCRVGMTSIKNSDDSVNGYISDLRTYV